MGTIVHLYAEHLGALIFASFFTVPLTAIWFLIIRSNSGPKKALAHCLLVWITLTNLVIAIATLTPSNLVFGVLESLTAWALIRAKT